MGSSASRLFGKKDTRNVGTSSMAFRARKHLAPYLLLIHRPALNSSLRTLPLTSASRRALSLDGWRHVAFIDDGLGALTALRGVASLNLQGCAALTDKGLEAIAHMTSLASVNLQDCRQISGACSSERPDVLTPTHCQISSACPGDGLMRSPTHC